MHSVLLSQVIFFPDLQNTLVRFLTIQTMLTIPKHFYLIGLYCIRFMQDKVRNIGYKKYHLLKSVSRNCKGEGEGVKILHLMKINTHMKVNTGDLVSMLKQFLLLFSS